MEDMCINMRSGPFREALTEWVERSAKYGYIEYEESKSALESQKRDMERKVEKIKRG